MDCQAFCTAEGSAITGVTVSDYGVTITGFAGNVVTMHVDSINYSPGSVILTITLANGEVFTRLVKFTISQH